MYFNADKTATIYTMRELDYYLFVYRADLNYEELTRTFLRNPIIYYNVNNNQTLNLSWSS